MLPKKGTQFSFLAALLVASSVGSAWLAPGERGLAEFVRQIVVGAVVVVCLYWPMRFFLQLFLRLGSRSHARRALLVYWILICGALVGVVVYPFAHQATEPLANVQSVALLAAAWACGSLYERAEISSM